MATAAGIPPSSGQQEAALLPEQQQKLEAAIHLLPEADKEAYQEALLKSPHLIALESPLRRYWQLESDPREEEVLCLLLSSLMVKYATFFSVLHCFVNDKDRNKA